MPSEQAPLGRLRVRVIARRDEAEGIAGFDLAAVDGGPLPAFAAGAHVDLHLAGGWVRPYSLCNPQNGGRFYRIAVQREEAGRGGSAAVHAQLMLGAVLDIGQPRNHFALEEGDGPVLLLAGGIGITPILAMAEELFAAGRCFALHYCSTSATRAAFVEKLRAAPYAAHVTLHHDDLHGRCDLRTALAAQPVNAQAYVCGPPGFIAAATAQGWGERMHVERFSALPMAASVFGAIEVQAGVGGPVVTVAPGTPITVALARAGIVIPVSCEQGVCGNCVTRVLQGEVEHRDFHLAPHEVAQGCMLPCCSWARSSRLVLDL